MLNAQARKTIERHDEECCLVPVRRLLFYRVTSPLKFSNGDRLDWLKKELLPYRPGRTAAAVILQKHEKRLYNRN